MDRKFRRGLLAAGGALALALATAACSSNDNNSSNSGTSTGGGESTDNGFKIGLLLPESKTARYEAFDKPYIEAKLKSLCPKCEVVYQNADKRDACQFSFACDGQPESISEPDAWATAMTLAKKIVTDEKTMYLAEVSASTHYHATYVRPDWAGDMQKIDKIGTHIFYKTYGGGWE